MKKCTFAYAVNFERSEGRQRKGFHFLNHFQAGEIKYNLPGGSLTVHLSRIEDNAVLTVKDTGMGIPEDAIGHVFERFYRVDKARSRATGGSGLGLAIVRSIVKRNRGEIQVSSIVGQGTTFTVTFPAFDTEVDPE